MIKACVIGHPISHSKSPLIHNHWIEKHELDGAYDKRDIVPENLKDGISQLIEEGYAGFNVTVPHKQAIMELCTDIDDTAQKIGAVNTVIIKDGKLYGRNTDAFGFTENIKQEKPGFNFRRGPACIIGAGGAARAVLYGLLAEGVPSIRLTNRSRSKAEELAQMAPDKIEVIEWDKRTESLNEAALVVNTTSLGMSGQPPLEFGLDKLTDKALVCDIVYAPLMTDLLQNAQGKGHDIVTGIGMLLHQARPAFQGWFGVMPEVDEELKSKVLA